MQGDFQTKRKIQLFDSLSSNSSQPSSTNSNQPSNLTNGEKLLCSLSKAFNMTQSNKLDESAQELLSKYAEKIMEKRKQEREKKQQEVAQKQYAYKGGIKPTDLYKGKENETKSITSQVIEEVSEEANTSHGGNYSYLYDELPSMIGGKKSIGKGKQQNSKATDYHLLTIRHLLKKALNEPLITGISEFFSTRELVLKLRPLNQLFNETIKKYLPNRLQQEAEFINAFLEENDEINNKFLKIVDTQIPLARNNWVEFDFQEVTENLQKLITKNDITNLKFFLKNPPAQKVDICLAPLCLLFNLRETRQKEANGQMKLIWHKQAFKLLQGANFLKQIIGFEKDILKEEIFLEVFEYLNREELDLEKVTSINASLAQFIKWARMAVSYHILVHPYKLRNMQTVREDTDVYHFLTTIDSFMDQFYQLKSFLIRIQVLPKETNFAFNLSHVKFVKKDKQCSITKTPNIVMDLTLCHLSTLEAAKLSQINKKFREYVASHWDLRLSYQILEVESLKTNHFFTLNKRIPLLYEGGFFSPYLKMLDRILFQEKSNFLSKYHIEEIKAINKPNKIIQYVVQAFCILIGIKPVRKGLPNGNVEIDYYTSFQSAIKGTKLTHIMNNFNKLNLKGEQLQQINLFLSVFLREYSLDQIKQISKGMFQLHLWTLSIVTYNKLLNPLNFITSDYVKKRFNQNFDDIQTIEQIYQALESWRYTFNIRTKNIQSYQTSIGNGPYTQQNHYASSIEQIAEKAKSIITDIEESQGINIIQSAANSIDNDSIFLQVTQELPNAAKPAFFEKVLIDFYNTYFPFENEISQVGDPFGVQEVKSLDFFNKQIQPVACSYSSTVLKSTLKKSSYNSTTQNQTLMVSTNSARKSVYKSPDQSPTVIKKSYLRIKLDYSILSNVLFYYNSVEQVVLIYAKLNRQFRQTAIEHLSNRLIQMSEETKRYEEAFEDIVESIKVKRNKFYREYYEIVEEEQPSKDKALQLLQQITHKDITNLRKVTKPTPSYEFFVAPLLILFDKQPKRQTTAEGKTILSSWQVAYKLFGENFCQKLRDFPLEGMTQEKFAKFSKLIIMNKDTNGIKYNIKQANQVNPALGNLVAWILGVYEFHRFLRGYSVTESDEKFILNKHELKFARKMDELVLKNFRIMRFVQEQTGVNPLLAQNLGYEQETIVSQYSDKKQKSAIKNVMSPTKSQITSQKSSLRTLRVLKEIQDN